MPLRIMTALAATAVIVTGALAQPAYASATATVTAPARTDLRACYDGACKLTLTKAVSFPVSRTFGITRLAVSFDRHRVRVKGTGPGVSSQALLGAGGSGSVNGIGIKVVSLSSKRVVVRLTG
ncbi:hypothetical protein [Nonomuraea sp. NPDC050783]|uniref:hypothetical protein n=1 Tax=Nonomuraea sp. NPDC050783 TaxID=3154634 RepID=UPI0034653D0D